MKKIFAAVVFIALLISLASIAEAEQINGVTSVNNIATSHDGSPLLTAQMSPAITRDPRPQQPQTPSKEKSFVKSNTRLNETTKDEVEDNGYVPSFITGTKVPIDMGRLGAGISVITSEVINEMHPSSIADILRIVPGVIITERGTNYVTAGIQGAPSGETTVMVDGISLNSPADPERAVDLSSININMNSIERIEIIKNPASIGNYYGASGGIINIITKNGEEQDYTISLYGDMLFNLENKLNGYRTGINFAGSKPTIKYALSYNRLEEIGISQAAEWLGNGEKDGSGSNNAQMRFTIMPIEGLKSGIYLSYTDYYKELDNSGGQSADNPAYKVKLENVLFGWDISYKVADIWEPTLKLQYKFMNKKYTNKGTPLDFLGEGKYDGSYNGQQVVFDFNNNFYIVKEFTLSAGAEYIYDAADIKENSLSEKIMKNKTADGVNAYAQATIDLFDAWTTVISAKGNFYGEYSGSGFLPTYGVSTAYNIENAGLILKASFGVGALAPTLYQKYDRDFGNINLKPEESMSYQAGFTNNLFDGIIIWGGSWFENFYKNMITKEIGGQYQNTGKAHTYGVEASLRINPADFMSIFGSYTWLNAYSLEGGKKKIDLMPEHSMTGGVIFKVDKIFSLNVNVNYVGERGDTPDYIIPATNTLIKQYYLLNTAMSINFTKNFEVYITGTNLMDTRYESVSGYGTRGLEIAVGLKVKM